MFYSPAGSAERNGGAVSEAPMKQEETRPGQHPFHYSVVDVSEGFLLRTAYKKKVDPSKLDQLLELRQKLRHLEEKQRPDWWKSAIATNPKVVIQRLEVKVDPVAGITTIRPEVKPEVKYEESKTAEGQESAGSDSKLACSAQGPTEAKCLQGAECRMQEALGGGCNTPGLIRSQSAVEVNNTSLFSGDAAKQCTGMDVSKGNQQSSVRTPAQLNNGASLGANGGESEGNTVPDNTATPKPPLSLQRNGKETKESFSDTVTKDSSLSNIVTRFNDRGIEADGKSLSLKEALKPLVNGNTVLGRGPESTEGSRDDLEYLPPQKVPRLGDTVEELALSSPTIPNPAKAVPSADGRELSSMEARLGGAEKRPVVPSPVFSGEESSVDSITQITTTTSTTTTTVCTAHSCSVSTFTTTTKSSVTHVTAPSPLAESLSVAKETKTTFTSSSSSSSPSPSVSVSVSSSTRERVQLQKFSPTRTPRSGTALPSYRKFTTKSCKKSIFVLPGEELRKLARKGGLREVSIFNYNAKPAADIWPYPSPRPSFGIAWRCV